MYTYIRSGQVRCAVRYIEMEWEPGGPIPLNILGWMAVSIPFK